MNVQSLLCHLLSLSTGHGWALEGWVFSLDGYLVSNKASVCVHAGVCFCLCVVCWLVCVSSEEWNSETMMRHTVSVCVMMTLVQWAHRCEAYCDYGFFCVLAEIQHEHLEHWKKSGFPDKSKMRRVCALLLSPPNIYFFHRSIPGSSVWLSLVHGEEGSVEIRLLSAQVNESITIWKSVYTSSAKTEQPKWWQKERYSLLLYLRRCHEK